jgi:hypothetical protein
MFLLHLFLEDLALVAPICFEAPKFLSLMVSRFLSEVNLKLGGNLSLGDNLILGHNLNLGGNLNLGDNLRLGHNLNLGGTSGWIP